VTTQKNAMVSVDHLNKVYESKERRVEAIGDLSFEVNQGDFTCIVGPSGAGKTTLLKWTLLILFILTQQLSTITMDLFKFSKTAKTHSKRTSVSFLSSRIQLNQLS
jgi:ABC-type lipoprotein export system ATPase subunit